MPQSLAREMVYHLYLDGTRSGTYRFLHIAEAAGRAACLHRQAESYQILRRVFGAPIWEQRPATYGPRW